MKKKAKATSEARPVPSAKGTKFRELVEKVGDVPVGLLAASVEPPQNGKELDPFHDGWIAGLMLAAEIADYMKKGWGMDVSKRIRQVADLVGRFRLEKGTSMSLSKFGHANE